MASRRAPQKSIFGTQKWYFPDLPFRGSVGGQPVCNPIQQKPTTEVRTCAAAGSCRTAHLKVRHSILGRSNWASAQGYCKRVARGLLGTHKPDLTLVSASPSLPQGSIWHRFDIDSTSIS